MTFCSSRMPPAHSSQHCLSQPPAALHCCCSRRTWCRASLDQLLALWSALCCCAALQSRSYLLLNEKRLNGRLTAKHFQQAGNKIQLKSNIFLQQTEHQQDPRLQNGHFVMNTNRSVFIKGQGGPQRCFSLNQLKQTLHCLLSKRETTSFLGSTEHFLLLPDICIKLDTFQVAMSLRENRQ